MLAKKVVYKEEETDNQRLELRQKHAHPCAYPVYQLLF